MDSKKLQKLNNITLYLLLGCQVRDRSENMAFVIDKAEKKSVFQLKQEQVSMPGPGAYQPLLKNSRNSQHCAPFNTSDIKTSSFEVEETKYGPGSYEPKYFKDINKANSNKGYVFASKVQRFATQPQPQANPKKPAIPSLLPDTLLTGRTRSQPKNDTTHYTFSPERNKNDGKQLYYKRLEKSKSVMDEIRMQNHENRVESIKGKREFVRVLLTSTTNTENIQSRYIYRNISGKTLGPGSYQNAEFQPKSKGLPQWKLDKNIRFKTENNIVPGPGSYKTPASHNEDPDASMLSKSKKRLSASFASTVIRSHMDTIIYRTNIPIKAAILEDKRLKDSRPGPGSYNTVSADKDKKSFNYGGENNFGCSERKLIEGDYENPGPGSYKLNEGNITSKVAGKPKQNKIIREIRNQIFGKKGKIANNDNKNNSLARSYISKGHASGLDPNFTDPKSEREKKEKRMTKFCSLEERCFSKFGNMSQEERFKREESQMKMKNQLGPGQYYNEKNDSGFNKSQQCKATNSVFKSGTERKTFMNQDTSIQVPYYNVIRQDIGFKAQKMRRYIENLKKINIEKTPFQTSTKRFKQQNESDLKMIMYQFEQSQKQTVSPEKPDQQSSNFKSKTKREIFKSEPKPGPGDYQTKMKCNGAYESIEKKSFNKNYGLMKDVVPVESRPGATGFPRKNSKVRAEEKKVEARVEGKEKEKGIPKTIVIDGETKQKEK